MKVIKSASEMQTWSLRARRQGGSIGFVPTMGALHAGHMALVERARRENEAVVVSIFVNPLQFGPKEDFRRYPRPLTLDLSLLKTAKVDIVFVPSAKEIYPEEHPATIRVPSLGSILEGASRPGHFEGVATVVAKLFNLVQPTRAYFGEKDFQQVRLIDQLVKDFRWPIRLVACPTVREPDGLARSSRNRYLSNQEREEAVKLYQALYLGRELIVGKFMRQAAPLIKRLTQIFKRIPHCQVDYIAVVDPVTLAPMKVIRRPVLLALAVRIGRTRLIDNMVIP